MRHNDLDISGLYVQSGTISTFSGLYIDTRNPAPESLNIYDIAHQLSMQPRYGGKLRQDYTVAQHCIECCLLADFEDKLAALLHDASEAYICDLPSPIKSELPGYKVIEDRIMKAISAKFGFEYPLNQRVKEIDKYMLELEWSSMVKNHIPYRIKVMEKREAEIRFINLYKAFATYEAA